ncbi:DUF6731 family protein [Neisseria dentiae]|uniref:DUF6731 family protein n=1 Tax=Neisseria dentiae TaxID=194197 RepID=UPI0035A1A223
MAKKTVNFHFYEISRMNPNRDSFEDGIKKLFSIKQLDQRTIAIKHQKYRLEKITFNPSVNGIPCHWELDFLKFRLDGPGLAELDKPTGDAKNSSNQFFNEECCALFFPNNGKPFIIIQYNHIGMRAAAIAEYISYFTNNQFEFRLGVKKDALSRIRKMNIFTQVHLDIIEVGSKNIQAQSQAGKGFISGIRACAQAAQGYRGIIEFKGKKTPADRLNFNQQAINEIIDFAQDPANDIRELFISGVENEDDRIDQVHFFKEKIEYSSKLNINLLSGRIDFKERIKAALSAYHDWRQRGYC